MPAQRSIRHFVPSVNLEGCSRGFWNKTDEPIQPTWTSELEAAVAPLGDFRRGPRLQAEGKDICDRIDFVCEARGLTSQKLAIHRVKVEGRLKSFCPSCSKVMEPDNRSDERHIHSGQHIRNLAYNLHVDPCSLVTDDFLDEMFTCKYCHMCSNYRQHVVRSHEKKCALNPTSTRSKRSTTYMKRSIQHGLPIAKLPYPISSRNNAPSTSTSSAASTPSPETPVSDNVQLHSVTQYTDGRSATTIDGDEYETESKEVISAKFKILFSGLKRGQKTTFTTRLADIKLPTEASQSTSKKAGRARSPPTQPQSLPQAQLEPMVQPPFDSSALAAPSQTIIPSHVEAEASNSFLPQEFPATTTVPDLPELPDLFEYSTSNDFAAMGGWTQPLDPFSMTINDFLSDNGLNTPWYEGTLADDLLGFDMYGQPRVPLDSEEPNYYNVPSSLFSF